MAARWLSSRRRYWLLLVWTMLGLALFLGVFNGVKRINRAARRIQHRNNLLGIWITLQNFNDVYGGLPPAVCKDKAGRPLCSWRFQILPFLQSWMTSPHPEFGEPWDSQANRYWAELGMPTYCWSSEKDSPEQFHTSVVAVTGPGTPFGHDRQNRLQDMDGLSLWSRLLIPVFTGWPQETFRRTASRTRLFMARTGLAFTFCSPMGKSGFSRRPYPSRSCKSFSPSTARKRMIANRSSDRTLSTGPDYCTPAPCAASCRTRRRRGGRVGRTVSGRRRGWPG